MTDPDAPIRTTHVGSLVRPAELVAYLRKIDAGEDYDEQAYQECLARSVRDVVQAQRDAGIDIVSDGEFGKSAWNYYVYERLGGIELRPSPPGDANFASVNDAPTDWARFPEFYADYFAHEQEYESPGGDWACVAPVTYTGGEVIARDIANLKAAMDAAGAQEGFLPVVAPASCFPNLIDEHYGSEEAALLGIADALAEEYRAIVDAGLNLQIDDAYIPFMYDVLVPPGTMDDYRAWAQPRIAALNHALEGIPQDKVRYHVCWGSWNGPHTNDIALRDVLELMFAGQRRHLPLRARQPAPRARVARLGGRRPAGRQDARPGRHQPRDERRRAPRARGRAPRAHRAAGRRRARRGQHGLRLRPGPVHPARAPDDPVGEAPLARGGRRARLARADRRAVAPGAPSSSAGARGAGPRPRPARPRGHAGRRRRALALAGRGARRRGRRRAARRGRGAERLRRARRPRRPRPDGRLPRRAARARRGLPPRRALRRDGRAHGRRRARQPAAPAGPRLRRRGGGHRGAQPRRDRRAADADRLRHRGAAAHEPAAARLRVLAPGQLGLAAAAGLQPHQPARLPRQRAVVHALRRADGAARRPAPSPWSGSCSRASSRSTSGRPRRARADDGERPALPRFALAVVGAHARGLRG